MVADPPQTNLITQQAGLVQPICQSDVYSALKTTTTARGCAATVLFTELFVVGRADHTENKEFY